MGGTPMDLLALAAFQQIAKQGGIGPASRAAHQPKTTLSRRLRELEEQLGVRLVERGPRVFRLTDEGAALHARTSHLLAEIDDAGQEIAGGFARPRGRLRVSVPRLFADVHMGRIAAEFAAAFPEVELEVLSDDRLVDPLAEGLDVVVRVNPPEDDRLVGRRVFHEDTLLVAPPALLRPDPIGSAKVQAVPAVMLPTTPEATWRVEADGRSQTFEPRAVLRLSSVLMAVKAVQSGAGAALLPWSVVEADLRAERLVCWGRLPEREIALWVLHTSRRLKSPKVAAFVEHLCAAFPERRVLAALVGRTTAPRHGAV